MKPSISQLIDEYSIHLESKKTHSVNEHYFTLERNNAEALHKLTYKDYSQEAFSKVISAIELNGITNFNMTTFWGKIVEGLDMEHVNNQDMLVHELTLHYEHASNAKNTLDTYTKSFNCNSVGCIAGFAMAVAMDWVQPKWLSEDSRNYMNLFEHVACNYLNIPLGVGRRVFYGDGGSIWGFLKFHEPETYGNIKWSEVDDFDIFDNDYDYDWQEESVDLSSIDYKTAVDALRRIVNGEITLDSKNDFTPKYSKIKINK